MSEQAEQTSGAAGSPRVEPTVPHSAAASVEPAAAEIAVNVESPGLVPEPSASGEAAEVSATQPEASREAAKETPKSAAPRMPGKVLIMSSADRAWAHDEAGPEVGAEPNQGMFGKRRLSALAAVVALAALAGALGGATATIGLQHSVGNDVAPATANNPSIDAAVARIDADIVALKASVEHTSRVSVSQFNKTSDRLDKVEKAQAEPAAKLAKLSEQVDKLRVTLPVPVAAAAPAKEVTGSVTPPAATAAAAPKPAEVKTEVGRLPTIEGWTLRDVANGGALIEGRQGIYEVYAGDPVPGLGRVDAIRRQDGRWVVVTSKGLIVAR